MRATLHKHSRFLILAAAVFMMAGLLGVEIAELETWNRLTAPAFVGKLIVHIGAVGTAWLAGKLAPQGFEQESVATTRERGR